MKRLDQVKKLKGMSESELSAHAKELSHELMNLRFRKRSRQLTAPAQIRNSRREIARAKTFMKQQSSRA